MDLNLPGKIIYKLGQQLFVIVPDLKRFVWRIWYNFIIDIDKESNFLFMNYGFEELEPKAVPIPLQPAEEKYRYRIQLYHHVAETAEMTGKKVLEVGCGCGGGAAYIATHFGPAAMKGLDYSQKAIEACLRHHADVPNLTFIHGNAEELPFESGSFDVVVNVESCHTYGKPARFFGEVDRVLRPQGYFLIADFRDKPEVPMFRQQLDARFKLITEENITPCVVRSLDLDNDRKVELIPPGPFQKSFQMFSGTKNSTTYNSFACGEMVYLFFVLQKKIVPVPESSTSTVV
jgi:ubiquinone/menaquinone biosynthesis C-methylase UbiE